MYRPNGASRYSATSRTKPLLSTLMRAGTSKVTILGACIVGDPGRLPGSVGTGSYPGIRGIRDGDPGERGGRRDPAGPLGAPAGRGDPPHRRAVRGGQPAPAGGRPAGGDRGA